MPQHFLCLRKVRTAAIWWISAAGKKRKISRLNVCKRSRVQTDKSRAKRCFYFVRQTDWAASDTHMSSCCRGLRGWGTNWNSRPGPPEGPASLRQPAEKWRDKKAKGLISLAEAAEPSTRCDPKAGPRHEALIMSRVIEHFLNIMIWKQVHMIVSFPFELCLVTKTL